MSYSPIEVALVNGEKVTLKATDWTYPGAGEVEKYFFTAVDDKDEVIFRCATSNILYVRRCR